MQSTNLSALLQNAAVKQGRPGNMKQEDINESTVCPLQREETAGLKVTLRQIVGQSVGRAADPIALVPGPFSRRISSVTTARPPTSTG